MAGYDGFSKSNNAVAAEACGRFSLSAVSKKTKIPSSLIKKFIEPSEWHHTSSWYNSTNYYVLDEVLAVFGKADDYDADGYSSKCEYYSNPDAIKALAEFASLKKAKVIYKNCEIEWIEWGGSRRHPIANKYKEVGDIEYEGGSFVKIILKNKTFKKKIGSNGFYIWWKDEMNCLLNLETRFRGNL